jgi:hypothetical protein
MSKYRAGSVIAGFGPILRCSQILPFFACISFFMPPIRPINRQAKIAVPISHCLPGFLNLDYLLDETSA